jgi:PAS domain-containing protein
MMDIFNAMSAHAAILDETGTILAVNEAWQRFGVENGLQTPDSGVGCNYLDLCDGISAAADPEAAQVAAAIRDLLAGRGREAYIEYPCHSPDAQRWFTAHFIISQDNGQQRILLVHENITDRKLTEVALHQSQNHLFKAFHHSPVPLCVTRASDGLFINANDAFLRLMGYKREELAHQTSNSL